MATSVRYGGDIFEQKNESFKQKTTDCNCLNIILFKCVVRWTDNGDWIEKCQRFMIFLPDDVPVFDFGE